MGQPTYRLQAWGCSAFPSPLQICPSCAPRLLSLPRPFPWSRWLVTAPLWSQHLPRAWLLAQLVKRVVGKKGNKAKSGAFVPEVYVKLYRPKFFKNRSVLHPHKHHFFVLFLSRPVTPHGPWNFPSGRHTGRHKAMKKISPALSKFCFLPCCSPHFIRSILTNTTTLEHRSWSFGQHPAVKCVLFFCMIHSTGVRKAAPHSPDSKNVCLSVKAWQRRCLYRQSTPGSFPKRNRKGIVAGERGDICEGCLHMYSEWRKGKGKRESFRRHSEHQTKLLLQSAFLNILLVNEDYPGLH